MRLGQNKHQITPRASHVGRIIARGLPVRPSSITGLTLPHQNVSNDYWSILADTNRVTTEARQMHLHLAC